MKLFYIVSVLLVSAVSLFETKEVPLIRQREYAIAKEAEDAMSQPEYRALNHAIAIRYPDPFSTNLYKKGYKTVREALGEALVPIYKDSKPKGITQKARFNKLYEVYVTKACANASALVKSIQSKVDEFEKEFNLDNVPLPYPLDHVDEFCEGLTDAKRDNAYKEFKSEKRRE